MFYSIETSCLVSGTDSDSKGSQHKWEASGRLFVAGCQAYEYVTPIQCIYDHLPASNLPALVHNTAVAV